MNAPDYMAMALAEAEAAARAEEVPVGAVIVATDGVVLARTGNAMRRTNDPTAHAEMLALREACSALGTDRLPNCDLYVTLEPCTMCAGALFWSQLGALIIGARDLKRGFSLLKPVPLHPKTKVRFGILESDCEAKVKNFFKKLRNKEKER